MPFDDLGALELLARIVRLIRYGIEEPQPKIFICDLTPQ